MLGGILFFIKTEKILFFLLFFSTWEKDVDGYTGHSGSFSSIHANSCRDALRRLETMVLMGMDMPLGAIQGLIASSVDILIHLGRCLNGERKILEISEIKDYSRTEYETHTLFQYDKDHGLEIREELFHVEKLKDYGQYEKYCEAVKLFREGRAEQKKARA